MNKEQFYRKDINTFKPKYFLYCKNCVIDNISPKIVAQKENKHYLCPIIIIKEA